MTTTVLPSSNLTIKGAGFNFICVFKEKGWRFLRCCIKIHENGYMKQGQAKESKLVAGKLLAS